MFIFVHKVKSPYIFHWNVFGNKYRNMNAGSATMGILSRDNVLMGNKSVSILKYCNSNSCSVWSSSSSSSCCGNIRSSCSVDGSNKRRRSRNCSSERYAYIGRQTQPQNIRIIRCKTDICLCQKAVNTLRPRHNGRHFADDIFKCIFLNENISIAIKISLRFVPKVPISNIPALVQIMAWRQPGDKALSEPMMVSLMTHICVTRPQWVKLIRLRTVVVNHIGCICVWVKCDNESLGPTCCKPVVTGFLIVDWNKVYCI